MDERQMNRPEDAHNEKTEEVDAQNLEQEFRLQREKIVENFVLDLDEETIAPDPEPRPEEARAEEENLSSFSEPNRKTRKRRERALSRRKKHGCMYRMLYFSAILALAVVISQFLVSGVYDLLGVSREPGEVEIVLEPGVKDEEVVEILLEAGAIKEPFFYTLYAKVTKAAYSPGTYIINRDADYEYIINSLRGTANRIDTAKITFIEGGTVEQFAKQLEKAKVCDAEEFLKALNEEDFTNYNFIKAIPNAGERAYALEGYLFPDTYEFYLYENPKTAVRRFLNNMNAAKLTREVYDLAEKQNMSVDQILILASMIQKEAGTVEDMYKISSVFHNRLDNWGENALLQSDPTYMYEDKLSAKYDGLYDTYVCGGLPVGPICNPGMEAIKAALKPAETKYYYFVADINGKTYYATTLAEHEKNIRYAQSVQPITSSMAPTVGD